LDIDANIHGTVADPVQTPANQTPALAETIDDLWTWKVETDHDGAPDQSAIEADMFTTTGSGGHDVELP
jgi:hypothetical protein